MFISAVFMMIPDVQHFIKYKYSKQILQYSECHRRASPEAPSRGTASLKPVIVSMILSSVRICDQIRRFKYIVFLQLVIRFEYSVNSDTDPLPLTIEAEAVYGQSDK